MAGLKVAKVLERKNAVRLGVSPSENHKTAKPQGECHSFVELYTGKLVIEMVRGAGKG